MSSDQRVMVWGGAGSETLWIGAEVAKGCVEKWTSEDGRRSATAWGGRLGFGLAEYGWPIFQDY